MSGVKYTLLIMVVGVSVWAASLFLIDPLLNHLEPSLPPDEYNLYWFICFVALEALVLTIATCLFVKRKQ
ncbi:putative membrane protein [Vibrio vulnificus]|jgi:hypothetical protein|uniref:Uncharacterized protein n=2 Tax=Vibrio harveyi TaxID=669 RepID=A0A8B3DFD4_VIBHA|nr:putative membrane protein [Vibrio vulnificus]OQK64369.1 putative membrane protein [Vibrio vulnificus]OQK66760.1 putative membrane protein [Vibrio vulnificus]RIV99922.1 hypothetical protein DS957_027635 [Vibrio harveyi]